MRSLSESEVRAVSGGIETITVTGTRPSGGTGVTSIYPDAWESVGMTAEEYIFGGSVNWDWAQFDIGPGGDNTDYIGVTVDIDTNGDGQTDFSVSGGVQYDPSTGETGGGAGMVIILPF